MTIECDVLVVGGGPAGCSAAFFSKYYDKENKYKVLLLERLPENKYSTYHDICGCCISQRAFSEIKPIKPTNIVENVKYIKEYVEDEYIWKYTIDGYIIDRPKFLANIIDEYKRIGGEFKQESVTEIIQEKETIKIKTDKKRTIKTKYLIAADGTNSNIRKQLKIGEIHKTPVIQYIVDKKPEQGVLKFYYDEKYKGDYKYVFPNGDTTKIGFPLAAGKEMDFKDKILKKQARVVGCGGLKNFNFGNILFVGDAAGQTNILSKGGIRPGMYAGKKAAESIIVHKKPSGYNQFWKQSIFNSQKIVFAFEELKKMNNTQIMEHYEPFKGNLILALLKMKILPKYRKYKEIYSAYRLIEKTGW